jgi:hypothetical protein
MGKAPNILLYESSEGSLGVMRRLAEEPDSLRQVFDAAWSLLHFDLPEEEERRMPPASYQDILSYYNQRHHAELDRQLARPALVRLRSATAESVGGSDATYEDHYARLCAAADPNSTLERRFLDHLYKRGLRLPDEAQKRVDGLYVQPDFYYTPNVYVFVDGTVHDAPTTVDRDERQRRALERDGYRLLVYRYSDDLDAVLGPFSDVIRKVR